MRYFCSLILLCALAACDAPPPTEPEREAPIAAQPETHVSDQQLSEQLWRQLATRLNTLTKHCEQQYDLIESFLAAPGAQSLQQAQTGWRTLHTQLAKTAPVHGLASSSPDLFAQLKRQLNRIAPYPIAPGYLDSINGYPYSGLIHDFSVPISRDTLRNQHQLTGNSEVLLGLHAQEFFLFGEGGTRTAADFIQQTQDTEQLSAHQRPENRRRTFLRLNSRLLCDDMQTLSTNLTAPSAPYIGLPAASQLALWHKAIAAELDTVEVNHCDFAPGGCPQAAPILQTTKQILALTDESAPNLIADDPRLKQKLQQLSQTLPDKAAGAKQTPAQTPPSNSKSQQSPDESGDPPPAPDGQ